MRRLTRRHRPELAWLGTETNQIGTDEFLHWCTLVGCEPYLCLNFGTGTLDEALNWVEYCNGTRDTHYANLRRANGHPEPYKVKYWALGNEVWGPWQVLQDKAQTYAEKAHQWAKALKLLDPNIQLVLCGETGHSPWDSAVLQTALPHVDMHSIHIYTASAAHLPNVTAPLAAEHSIRIASSMIDLALVTHRLAGTVGPERRTPKVCFDEWNVWDPQRAPGYEGAEENYSLSDALAVGVWLNVFVRQADKLGMCNIAQNVNVLSPLMTTKDGIRKQTTWWPLWLFSNYMKGTQLGVHVECGVWQGPEKGAREGGEGWQKELGWLENLHGQGGSGVPWLDVSAAYDDEYVNLAVVNISPDEDIEVALPGLHAGKDDILGYEVNGNDLLERGGNDAGMKDVRWDGKGRYKFPKHSLTLLRSRK